MSTPAGAKRKELLELISRTQRATTNAAVLTICQGLHARLVEEAANEAAKPKNAPAAKSGPLSLGFMELLEKLGGVLGCDASYGLVLDAVRKLKKDSNVTRNSVTSTLCAGCIRRREIAAKAQRKWRKTHPRPPRPKKAKPAKS